MEPRSRRDIEFLSALKTTGPRQLYLLTQSAFDPNLIFLLENVASFCRIIADHAQNILEGNLGFVNATNIQGGKLNSENAS
jgi:hypothetical protein